MSRPVVRRERQRGQILAIGAIGMITMLSFAALVLEGGNAYAQQRIAQNGSDSAANAGAVVLAQRLGGVTKTDGDVLNAMNGVINLNQISSAFGRYTNVKGQLIDTGGNIVANQASAATVGGGTIPPNAQGVAAFGTRTFDTVFARIMGISTLNASADATAVTGELTGGPFLPVIFPVNITDCENNGNTGVGESQWVKSPPGDPPPGQEYIVPLCKTGEGPGGGGGSFQILDLDPNLRCDEEVANPPIVQWDSFPVDVPVDNGNNCAKPIAAYVNAHLQHHVVLIPICDAQCIPSGHGSNALYHVIKVAAFYIDYMSDQNGGNNTQCQEHGGLVSIAGNGSSACLVGWFVRWFDNGPVGSGSIGNSDAIGIQLIK